MLQMQYQRLDESNTRLGKHEIEFRKIIEESARDQRHQTHLPFLRRQHVEPVELVIHQVGDAMAMLDVVQKERHAELFVVAQPLVHIVHAAIVGARPRRRQGCCARHQRRLARKNHVADHALVVPCEARAQRIPFLTHVIVGVGG